MPDSDFLTDLPLAGDGWSLYSATKHAVTGMTKSAGPRLRPARHPCERGRPRPGGDAAALEGNRRRPAQLRLICSYGEDWPARRDR
jgi:hypothetical protein